MIRDVLGARTGRGEGLPDVERLRAVFEFGDLPPEVQRRGRRELELMLASSPGDSDYNHRFTYLRWLAGLPWKARDEARIDLPGTRKLLDERHSGLQTAKVRVLEFLAARKLGGGRKGSILCFIGPPGVGKTSLARGVADAMGRKLVAVSCGGLSDETELRGHNRTWSGAQPGRIVRELVGIGVKNPVLVLDEIDKMQRNARGAGRAVRVDVATTGEITLSGNVLAVGGVKEKVLATRRNGLAQVVLPRQNESRAEDDLGDDLRREIGVRYVSTIDEARDLALLPPAARQDPSPPPTLPSAVGAADALRAPRMGAERTERPRYARAPRTALGVGEDHQQGQPNDLPGFRNSDVFVRQVRGSLFE